MVHVESELETIEFAKKAGAHFASNPQHWTYTDGDIVAGCLFAMRYGLGNDCVVVFRLDEGFIPVNFQQLITQEGMKRAPITCESPVRVLEDIFQGGKGLVT